MPHQCVRCNTFYEDGADEILKGCSCGAKLFFYVKKSKLEAVKSVVINMSDNEKAQVEKDVLDIVGEEQRDQPVVLDMESIRIQKPGKYEIDLVPLFKGEPLIYKVGEGKYIVDIIRSFKEAGKRKI